MGSPSNSDEVLRAHLYAAASVSVDEVVEDWNRTYPERTVGVDKAELRTVMRRIPDDAFIPPDGNTGLDFSVRLAAYAATALTDADHVFTPTVNLLNRNANSPAPLIAVLAAYRTAVVAVERREKCEIVNESRVRHLHHRLNEGLRSLARRRREEKSADTKSDVDEVEFALWRLAQDARRPEAEAPRPPKAEQPRPRWDRRHKMVAGVAGAIAAVLVVVVVAVLVLNSDNASSPTSTTQTTSGVPPGAAGPVPPPVTVTLTAPVTPSATTTPVAGFSGTALLKNTRVQLTALTEDGREVDAGQLPTFAPLTIDVEHGITFRLQFSTLDSQAPMDSLSFFIQPLEPVKVQGAHQVSVSGNQSLSQLDAGQEALVVPAPAVIDDRHFATYEFVLAALESRSNNGYLNNGYFCGYTPKPVTAVVRSAGNELAIPYPVFIKRAC